ncbi:MAG: GHKL domain-containing protein [Parasporobacterium sp.]|nr:GHKL domain-containing protein [Parasporobacterium sp.]
MIQEFAAVNQIYALIPACVLSAILYRKQPRFMSPVLAMIIYLGIAMAAATGGVYAVTKTALPNLVVYILNIIVDCLAYWIIYDGRHKLIRATNFFFACAEFSYIFGISNLIRSSLEAGGEAVSQTWALVIECAVSVIIVTVLGTYSDRVFVQSEESEVFPGMWFIGVILSIVFLYMNLFFIISSRSSELSPATSGVFIAYEIFLFALLNLLYIIFSIIWKEFREFQRLRDDTFYKDIHEQQYANLLNQMDRFKKQRHDFKHALNTIRTLSEKGQYDELKVYLNEYEEEINEIKVETFCLNAPVNATLTYYSQLAARDHIQATIRVVLPPEPVIPNNVLCGILGNLMENAIDGACTVPEEEREFSLSVYVKDMASLFITASNTFDGNVRMRGDRYLTTKTRGTGTGTQSMKYAVEKYKGTLSLHHTDKEFFTDIYIPLPKEKENKDEEA